MPSACPLPERTCGLGLRLLAGLPGFQGGGLQQPPPLGAPFLWLPSGVWIQDNQVWPLGKALESGVGRLYL